MKDLFEEYWNKQPEFAGKDTAQAAWTDGRALLLLQVIIRVQAAHRAALDEVVKYPAVGSDTRVAAAATANIIGKLLVTLSEMK
jgi:hypothetical protein